MEEDLLIIEVKAYGISHRIELPDNSLATEFIEACTKLAESVGFSPQLVIEGLRKAVESRE